MGAALARLLPPVIRNEPRHGAFFISRLLSFCAGLAALPFCLFIYGMPQTVDLLLLAGMTAPLFGAVLVCGGRLEMAQMVSSLGMIFMIGCLASQTGGLNSFLIGWLIVVLIEAGLSGSSRVLTCALGASGALSAILCGASFYDLLPQAQPPAFTALALLSAACALIANAYALASQLNDPPRTADDKYRQMIEHAPDTISLHSRSGNVLLASAAAKDMFGDAQPLFERVHVQDRPAFLAMFERAESLKQSVSLEFRLRRGDGFIWVEMNCAPLNGEKLQFVGVTREIFNRRDKEESLRRIGEKAEKENVAKSRMLAQLGHDLRTPLTALLGFSEILSGKAGLALSTRRKNEYAALVHLSGRHMLDVVESALDIGQAQVGTFTLQPQRFQPAELVEHCLMLMQPQATKAGITLKRQPLRAVPEIFADRRVCMRILLNLIANAMKFTPRNGTVTLGLSFDEKTLSFAVADTGAKFDADYETSDIGLSLAKSFAQMQGGSIKLSASHGTGTIATVTLPRHVKMRGKPRALEEAPAPLQAVG